MFVKTNDGNLWINLSTCRSVQTHQFGQKNWRILLSSAVILPDTVKQDVGQFETETEAEEALAAMWQAYRDGEKTWEVGIIRPRERWTAERFKALASDSEHSDSEHVEKMCELGADLMNLVQSEGWELTHEFKQVYFALYFEDKHRVFGIRLDGLPKLDIWNLDEDILADLNDAWFDGRYACESYRHPKEALYPPHVKVENIERLLAFAYSWHADNKKARATLKEIRNDKKNQ